jgi:putative MATE family efflux protein
MVLKRFVRYVIPSVVGSVVTSLYLVVDGVFIARGVGETGVAAVTLILPLTMAFIAISMVFSVGGANLVSISLGSDDPDRAVSIFRQSVCTLMIIGAMFSLAGAAFADDIAVALGATGRLRLPAAEYMRYYMAFTIPVLLAMALSTFIRHDGSPRLSMRSMLWGAMTNILLDYVFVFPLKLGLKGAAIATGLGQLVTVLACMRHFAEHRGVLTIGGVRIRAQDVKDIVVLGIPSFLAEVSYSVLMYMHNIEIAGRIGEIGVTSYGVVNYINNLAYMALLGICQGIQPLMSYYYGCGKPEESGKYRRLGIRASMVVSASFLVICLLLGKPMIRVFASSPGVVNLAYTMLNYTNVAYIMLGMNLIYQAYLQSVYMPRWANVICLLRGFVFVKIGLVALPQLLGDTGIWATMIFSEAMTLVVASWAGATRGLDPAHTADTDRTRCASGREKGSISPPCPSRPRDLESPLQSA